MYTTMLKKIIVVADDNSKASSSGELYNVDAIVGGPNKCGEYRVKWEGYSSD